MNKIKSPYTAAITGGGFLYEETCILLPLLQSGNRESLLKDEALNNRLLQINSETSRKRNITEVSRRYDAMQSSFWEEFVKMDEDNRKVALFFVILKTYKICFDFHINVTIRKWNSISKRVDLEDLMIEFNISFCASSIRKEINSSDLNLGHLKYLVQYLECCAKQCVTSST